MSQTATAERVTMTREEYEALRAAQPATVTIPTAEYQALKARQNGIDPTVHQRVLQRLAEVEQLLRREMQEHAAEIETMTKALAHR